MAQYAWRELAASGLFIYIQRKLGVKENSAIWQKLKQSQQEWAGADIPKRLSQGAITLGFLSWGAKAEQPEHQAAHSMSVSAQRRKHRAHEQSRDTEPFRLLSALHWKSGECWQEQENSFWGDPGCWCQFQWQSHQASCTDMRRVHPLPDKFCIYLFSKAIILIEEHVAWAIQQVTPKYRLCFQEPRKRKQTRLDFESTR